MPASEQRATIQPPSSVIIENVSPLIDCGRYPVKREVGDVLVVEADIFKEGHDKLAARLLHRPVAEQQWRESEMSSIGNDRWQGSFPLTENTRYLYTIEAFPAPFESWKDELTKKLAANLDVSLELEEGRLLVQRTADHAGGDAASLRALLDQVDAAPTPSIKADLLMSAAAETLMARHLQRGGAARFEPVLEVVVDRIKARYAAWYELFPRSAGVVPGHSGTFDDVIARLPYVEAMGFDVLYFPPIHPIGRVNRKGPNNTLNAGPNDPGVPYAIGNEIGGHDAIEPSLGTIDDFDRLVAKAKEHGLELALDFAIQAAPDHPWSTTHPEWFYQRPDGTIKYAENPPKKYEDIYPINFHSADWQSLWDELKRIVLFWVSHGVKIFRVDNPHTKPTPFWEWLISEVQRDHPDVIFLAEAFTRPKVMKSLAKAGFTQSYSYFTWRNYKDELIEYFTELTQTNVRDYMRANLFPNTPDILPVILQTGGRPAFQLRLILAATLSSVYGIYSGFELSEAAFIPGKEEYLNSEKYDYKVWDWDRPGNIIEDVARVNRIRRDHPALHEYDNLRFFSCDNANMLCYGKASADGSDVIVVVANLDPHNPHETFFHLPIEEFGIAPGEPYDVDELVTGMSFTWTGGTQHLYLDPNWNMALIYSIRRPRPIVPDDASS